LWDYLSEGCVFKGIFSGNADQYLYVMDYVFLHGDCFQEVFFSLSSGSSRSRGSHGSRGKPVSLMVNGRPVVSKSVETPLDLLALIEMTAQRNGLNRYEVFINGYSVSPGDVSKVFEGSDRMVVDIRQDDRAAGVVV